MAVDGLDPGLDLAHNVLVLVQLRVQSSDGLGVASGLG